MFRFRSEFDEAREELGADFRRFNQNEARVERQTLGAMHRDEDARLARLAKFAAEVAKLEG